MNVTTHERPGVYSSYTASSVTSGSASKKTVGLVAINTKATAGEAKTITSYEAAVAAFGSGSGQDMAELIRLILKNGAGKVVALPIADSSGYGDGFQTLAGYEEIQIQLCDSTDVEVQQALRDSVMEVSAARMERIAVVCGAPGEGVEELVQRAGELNCERVVLVAPGGVNAGGTAVSGVPVAAAVAGAIASQLDPSIPLGGAQLKGLYGLESRYNDNELDALIAGGITPVESMSGMVTVVRGVTTRTSTGGAADKTWRELATILIADDVIPGIRNALRSKFHRAKNTAQTRGAIRSQVILELENKLAKEIITQYEQVTVEADADQPDICLVDFSFTVAHTLNQIWITAHITV